MSKMVYRGSEVDEKDQNTQPKKPAAETPLTYRCQHNDHKAPIESKGGDEGQTYRGTPVKK